MSKQDTAQTRFDGKYITSTQIMKDLNVSRTALLNARKRGLLPDPVVVNDGQLYLWERTPLLNTNIEAWKLMLGLRRNKTA